MTAQNMVDVRVEAILIDEMRRQRLLAGTADAASCIELVVGVDSLSGTRLIFSCHDGHELQRIAGVGRAFVPSESATPVPGGMDERLAVASYGCAMAGTVARAALRTDTTSPLLRLIGGNWWSDWLGEEVARAGADRFSEVKEGPFSRAPDVIVCVSPTRGEVAEALEQVAHLGTVIVAGTYRDDAIEIPSYYQNIILKESVILAIDRPDSALVPATERVSEPFAGAVRSGPSFEEDLRAVCRAATTPFVMVRIQ